jgi:hypothetical protein
VNSLKFLGSPVLSAITADYNASARLVETSGMQNAHQSER